MEIYRHRNHKNQRNRENTSILSNKIFHVTARVNQIKREIELQSCAKIQSVYQERRRKESPISISSQFSSNVKTKAFECYFVNLSNFEQIIFVESFYVISISHWNMPRSLTDNFFLCIFSRCGISRRYFEKDSYYPKQKSCQVCFKKYQVFIKCDILWNLFFKKYNFLYDFNNYQVINILFDFSSAVILSYSPLQQCLYFLIFCLHLEFTVHTKTFDVFVASHKYFMIQYALCCRSFCLIQFVFIHVVKGFNCIFMFVPS